MSGINTILAAFLPATAGLSAVLTGLAIPAARRLRLLAHPVERSSHAVPTPQVGGVGICLALLSALVFLPKILPQHALAPGTPAGNLRLAIVGIAALGLVIGLLDDIKTLGALPKLAALILLSVVPVWFGISFSSADLPFAGRLGFGPWLGGALAVCWMVFFINAFNFMDGANGQSGVFALNALVWSTLVGIAGAGIRVEATADAGAWVWIVGAVAAAVLGFLPWNFPRAAIFMGDSGSLPVGGILAALTLFVAGGGFSSFVGLTLALSMYIYDVLYTLARRARRGENLLRAHRSHLYQRLLISTGWSHARLLAFHLPFYALTGAASVVYHMAGGRPARLLAVAGVAVLLVIYTLIVLRAERVGEERARQSAGTGIETTPM